MQKLLKPDYRIDRKAYRKYQYSINKDKELSRHKQWAKEHPEKMREYYKRYKDKYRDKKRAADRKSKLKREYGITQEYYIYLENIQKRRCAICGTIPKRLHVDHCHETDQVRGLLCGSCNRGIGMFKDNPAIVLSAHFYLLAGKP